MRNERVLVAFTGATNLADAVLAVALPLTALSLGASTTEVAAVTTALTAPWLLAALHVGVLVDRVDRRRLMVAAELTRLAVVLTLVGLHATGTLRLAAVYPLAVLLGLAEVVALTAAASIVPQAVPRHRWEAASSRITALEYLCNGFLGRPVGGLLVAAGLAWAFGVTAVVYVVGVLALLALAGDFSPVPGERGSVHRDIREGLAYLWQRRLLRTMALLIAGMASCWAAWLAVIPSYAVGGPLGLDARGFGLLLTALGAGGVVGAMVVGPVNRLLGRRWAMLVDIVGSTALVAVPALVPAGPAGAVPVALAAFVAGLGGTMWTVNARVIIASAVPVEMLGRFNAASRLVGWGAGPVAALAAGLLAEELGFRVAFGSFAVLCLLLLWPFLRVVTREAIAEAVDAPGEAHPAAEPAHP